MEYALSLNRDEYWHMDQPHFHESCELLLSLTDAGSFFVDRHLYPITRGALFVMPDAVIHRSMFEGRALYERYVLHFGRETLRAVSTAQTDLEAAIGTGCRMVQLTEEELPAFCALFEACADDTAGFGGDVRRNMAFTRLLLEVCDHLRSPGRNPAPYSAADSRVVPMLDYIQAHLGEPLPLDELAARFFMSKYHFCHLFKQHTGFSPGDYILRSRIYRARGLLREGYGVQQAGEAVGFGNNAHFIRMFTKLTGTSPGRYARQYRAVPKV